MYINRNNLVIEIIILCENDINIVVELLIQQYQNIINCVPTYKQYNTRHINKQILKY